MGYVAGYDYLCYFKIMSLNKRKIKRFEDLSFKELEKILIKNNVIFPKMWPAEFNPKQRKRRKDELWKDQRIYMYIVGRCSQCLAVLTRNQLKLQAASLEELIKQWKKPEKKRNWYKYDQLSTKSLVNNFSFLLGLNIKKKNGKIFYGDLETNENTIKDLNKIRNYTNEQIKKNKSKLTEKDVLTPQLKNSLNKGTVTALINALEKDIVPAEAKLLKKNILNAMNLNKIRYDDSKINQKLQTKKKTINFILNDHNYWKMRETTIGKNSKDQKDISLFRKETQDFYKCTMKVTDSKYNSRFFQNFTKDIDRKSNLDNFWKKNWAIIKRII